MTTGAAIPPIQRRRVAVLLSGRGSNMAALLAAARDPAYPANVALVVSNVPGAEGLARAATAGVPILTIPSAGRPRAAFERELDDALQAAEIEVVALAGFMRILSAAMVARWPDRILNIHPSLLPAYPGLDTHARALADGARLHGCSVHVVTAALDAGPVIVQAPVPVLADDTPATLAARVLAREHVAYPLALSLWCSGRARRHGDRIVIDGRPGPLLLAERATEPAA